MNRGLITTSIVMLLMVTGFATILLSANEADGYIDERVTPYEMNGREPAFDGVHLVYEGDTEMGSRVFLRNMETGNENMIGSENAMQPDVSGDRVVYRDYIDSNYELFEYTISSGTNRRLTFTDEDELKPRVDGKDLAYYVNNGGNTDVYHVDLVTNGVTLIDPSSNNELLPNVHDGKLVYSTTRGANSAIKIYHISSGTLEDVVNSSHAVYGYPDIFGDRVVFKDNNYDYCYLWNMTTNMLNLVSDPGGSIHYPRIWGDKVVYQTDRGSGLDLEMFDIERGATVDIASGGGHYMHPVVWGEHVFFTKQMGYKFISHILLDWDNDGFPDQKDMFPYDPNEHFDLDGDGIGDFKDIDDDGDGYDDSVDEFPRDDQEWLDYDGDGVADNQDTDDDNDGYPDTSDSDPYNHNTAVLVMLERIMTKLETMETNLDSRLDDIENMLKQGFGGYEKEVLDQINKSIVDIGIVLDILNDTRMPDMEGRISSMEDLLGQLNTSLEGVKGVDMVDSFFDILDNLTLTLTSSVLEEMEWIKGNLDNNTEDLENLQSMLESLQGINEIADDLENLGKDIESQNQDIEESGTDMKTYVTVLAILFSIWALIILAFVFVRTRENDGSEEM